MPISSTSRKAGPFYGNGAATTFEFKFKIFEPSDLRVVRFSSALGVDLDLVAGVDYSITLNPDQDEAPGGTVILAVAPAIGDRVVLLSDVPDTQPVDLTNQGGFYPDLLNGGLDRSTIQVQQLREELGRAIKLPPTAEDGEYVLPLPQGNQLLAWGQDGKTITNLDPGELISVVTYGNTKADVFAGDGTSTAFALSASPGSVNNLAISIDGVVQVPEIDYTWGGGKALSFVVPPPAGTRIFVRYQEALDEGTDVSGKADKSGGNLTKDDADAFRSAIGVSVPTLAALKTARIAASVFVSGRSSPGDGYAGTFEWVEGDQSVNVTKDAGQGVWVAPSAVPSGAAGAWKRVFDGPAVLDWFAGVDPTGATPSHVGLQRAFNAGFPVLRGSPGAVYAVSADNLSVPSNLTLENVRLRRVGFNVGWLLKNSAAGPGPQNNENITLRNVHLEDSGVLSGRGNMLKMDGVKNLTIEDSSVFMSSPYDPIAGAWSTFIAGEDIRISGWRVNSLGAGLWSDGMHIGKVQRFSMTDFHIRCGDDGIALHFPPGSYGWLNGPSKDIVIGNGYVEAAEANGLRIGAYGSDEAPGASSRWENVRFHDITFGPCKGCISIYDNRSPSEITSKNTGIVFDGMNFGDQANVRLIWIAGNPNTEVASNYTQHNFRDITLRNIDGRQSLGQLITGGGADRLVLENVNLFKMPGSPVAAIPDVWVRQVDETLIRDSSFITTETGSAIRFQLCRDVTVIDPQINGGTSNPFALVVMDRPTEFNAKFRMLGGTVSGGQRLFNGNGSGTLDEFTVDGTCLSNFTVSNTSILAATLYQFNPVGKTLSGPGSPEGVITAPRGTIWLRTDGVPTQTVYVKGSVSGNTGWFILAAPSAGTTAQRPTGVVVGYPYYDTTLGKPIWFKSPGWVDATGAAV